MTESENKSWLAPFPVAGYEVEVILKTGHKLQIPWARISTDGRKIHIGVIKKEDDGEGFPIIGRIIEMEESEVSEISMRDEALRPDVRVFRRPLPKVGSNSETTDTGWLKDLPKSSDCGIFLLCENRDRLIRIEKGWIEYDARKIHLSEIISRRKDPETGVTKVEAVRHERDLGEVIAILISAGNGPTAVFARVIRQKPVYKR